MPPHALNPDMETDTIQRGHYYCDYKEMQYSQQNSTDASYKNTLTRLMGLITCQAIHETTMTSVSFK